MIWSRLACPKYGPVKCNDPGQEKATAAQRIAELEAENAALRRMHRADTHSATDAEARHGRAMAAGRADVAAAEAGNEALRRAVADLAASRAALREREERLRLILASATDYAIIGMDLDRRVTSWNEGAARLLGWTAEEIVGRSADLIFTPEDREAGAPVREAEGALRDGRAANEPWHVRNDGTRFWANGLMLPLRDPDADRDAPPDGLLKIMRDETGRRRAEDALREGERRLRATQDHAGVGIHEVDAEGRYTRVNGTFTRMTGYTVEDFAGRAFWDFIEEEADRRDARDAFARLVRGEIDSFAVERAYTAKDGRRWWAEVRTTAIRDEHGRFLYAVRVVHDITARKQAEKERRRFAHVVEQSSDFIGIADPEGRAVFVNEAGRRMVGLGDMEAARRTRVIDYFAPEDRPFVEGVILPTMRREGRWVGDFRFRHFGTGAPVSVRYNQFEIRDDEGRAIGVATVSPDIAERKRAEARRAALVELGDRLRDLRDPGEIAHTAAEVIGRALGAARAGYGAVDAAQRTFRVERDWTDGRVASSAGDWRLADFWTGFAADLRRGEVVAIDDVAQDPRTAGSASSYLATDARAFLNVPVVEAGRVTAVLYVQDATPRLWTAEEVAFARGAAERAWAAAERARADERRALLVNELNHRVKNTLAVVQSIALQTVRGATDLPSFAAAFQARLIALARAHDLLTREHWAGAALGAVARAAVEPNDPARVDLGACASDELLTPAEALALAMALHELATNAAKHGALSVPGGRVSVACRADPEDGGARVVEWVERGGPPVAGQPARKGFGLRLLERGLAAQAGMARTSASSRRACAAPSACRRRPPVPRRKGPERRTARRGGPAPPAACRSLVPAPASPPHRASPCGMRGRQTSGVRAG